MPMGTFFQLAFCVVVQGQNNTVPDKTLLPLDRSILCTNIPSSHPDKSLSPGLSPCPRLLCPESSYPESSSPVNLSSCSVNLLLSSLCPSCLVQSVANSCSSAIVALVQLNQLNFLIFCSYACRICHQITYWVRMVANVPGPKPNEELELEH